MYYLNFLSLKLHTSRYTSASCDGKKSIVLCFISSPKVYSWIWLLFLNRNVCATFLYPTRYIKLLSRVFLVRQLFRQIFKLIVNIDFFYEIFLRLKPKLYKKFQYKDWSEMKMTKVFSKISLIKSSKNNFIFLPAFYLIIWLMTSSNNFEKTSILKIW